MSKTLPANPRAARKPRAARRSPPEAKFRMRVVAGDAIAIGPGKIALLEAIDATRSITAAARALGMSYRRAWVLVDELNASLKAPAVSSLQGGERGGGSELTDAGRSVVSLYRRIEVRAEKSAAADIRALLALVRNV